MAESKKSFIAYSDWKETFDSLPDEYAGKLIKHIFAYVNDENPTTEDFVINSVFANIKNTLKRDLDKWEKQIEQRSEAGKKSAEARRKKQEEDNLLKNKELQEQRNSTSVETRTTNINEDQRNSTDNVSVSVSVSDNVILLEKETKDILEEKLISSETELKTEKEKAKKVSQKKVIVSGQELTHEEAFQKFWNLYDKKTDTAKAKAKFLKLSESDMILAIEKVSMYVLSTPDKKYRKNALTWLNGKCWNDEVEIKTQNNSNNGNTTYQQPGIKKQYQYDHERAMQALLGKTQ